MEQNCDGWCDDSSVASASHLMNWFAFGVSQLRIFELGRPQDEGHPVLRRISRER